MDLNIDEDTLMKLAPFYRTSLALSTGPSRLIYYERFEIHPIKVKFNPSWLIYYFSGNNLQCCHCLGRLSFTKLNNSISQNHLL